MKIVYKPHLKIRLKQREIPTDYPKQIIESPEQEYFDTLTKRNVVIKKLKFERKLQNMLVAYDIIGDVVEAVTIHIISDREIENKVRTGRWRKYEKN